MIRNFLKWQPWINKALSMMKTKSKLLIVNQRQKLKPDNMNTKMNLTNLRNKKRMLWKRSMKELRTNSKILKDRLKMVKPYLHKINFITNTLKFLMILKNILIWDIDKKKYNSKKKI